MENIPLDFVVKPDVVILFQHYKGNKKIRYCKLFRKIIKNIYYFFIVDLQNIISRFVIPKQKEIMEFVTADIETFLKAKKDKNLSAVVIQARIEEGELKCFIRLCINNTNQYTDNTGFIFVELPTTIKVEAYGHSSDEIKHISFYESVYQFDKNHVNTFLDSIKKNSVVSFKVVAYNNNNIHNELNLVHHTLYAIIDNKQYMLSDYVGCENTVSPVQLTPSKYFL